MNEQLTQEEKYIKEVLVAARSIQTFLWGESNGSWGLEEWRRMFIKRVKKIELIDPSNPHAIVELKKRLVQNAALSIALINILHFKKDIDIINDEIPSNLPEYTEYTENEYPISCMKRKVSEELHEDYMDKGAGFVSFMGGKHPDNEYLPTIVVVKDMFFLFQHDEVGNRDWKVLMEKQELESQEFCESYNNEYNII